MHRVCRCEFCNTEYEPRAQVKNPRACPKDSCQQSRQKANEKSWHDLHVHLSNKEYHRVRRQQRRRHIQAIAESILKSIKVGTQFLNQVVDHNALSAVFINFISNLGVRRANKFWQMELAGDFATLS